MSTREELERFNKMKISIFNIPIGWFLLIVVITLFAMYTGNLPAGMVGALLMMMVLGEFFGWIGIERQFYEVTLEEEPLSLFLVLHFWFI